MSIWKTAIACSLAGAVMAGQIEQAAAAPMPTNVATMKAAVGDDTTQVHWRGRGFGWGFGGLAAGAIIGSAARPPVVVAPAPVYAVPPPPPPTCYWAPGAVVWDPYRAAWVRPQVQVCN